MKVFLKILPLLLAVLTCVAVLAVCAPSASADDPPWELDSWEELGCNNVKCTFCRPNDCDTDCNNPLDEDECFSIYAGSVNECEEFLADLNENGLGGGLVTPSREYIHAITDWSSVVRRPSAEACAHCGEALPQPRPRPFALELVRTFRSRLFQGETTFGHRWQHNYDYELELLEGSEHIEAVVRLPSNTRLEFVDIDKTGSFVPWNETLAAGPRLEADGDAWLLTTRKGARLHFVEMTDDVLVQFRPDWVEDRTGYRLSFAYDGESDDVDRLESVTDSFGRTLSLDWDLLWDVWPVVTRATLPDGRTIDYAYTTLDDYTVTYPNGDVSTYTFDVDADGEVFAFHDALGSPGSRKHRVYTTASGQVRGVTDVHGNLLFVPRNIAPNTIRYEYSTGRQETLTFDGDGYPVSFVQEDTGATRSWTWNPTLGLVTSSTDALGHTTTYAYEDGQLVLRTWPDGAQQTFLYDSVSKQMLAAIDENGETTYFTYDGDGNVQRVDHPDGTCETRVYGPYGLLQSVADNCGHLTRFEWDAHGYLARKILPDDDAVPGNEPVWDYLHDVTGRLLSIQDPLGRETSWDWDAVDRVVRTVHPDGTTEESVYGANGGDPVDLAGTTNLVLARKDRNGVWTQSTYDGLDNALTLSDPLGLRTTWTYLPATRLVQLRDEEGDATWFEYDARGRMATRNVQADATSVLTWTYEYDPLDRLVRETDPYGFEALTEYDSRGRILTEGQEIEPLIFAQDSYEYDPVGNRIAWTGPNGHATTFTYDSRGRLLETSNSLGHVTTREYDVFGNLSQLTDPLGNVTSWTHTARHQRASELDALGGVRTWTWDLADQLLQENDPLGIPTTYQWGCCARLLARTRFVDGGPADITERWTYDGEGQVIEHIDGEGFARATAYDPRGRVVARMDPEGHLEQILYTPDGSSLDPRLAAGQGRLETHCDALGYQTLFAFDGLGRTLTERDALGQLTTWTYDLPHGDGIAVRTTDRNGHASLVQLDGLQRKVAEVDALGNTTEWTYDAAGNLTILEDALGRMTTWRWDAAGRLEYEELHGGATTFYSWSPTDLLTRIARPGGETTRFVYDALGRLVERQLPDGVTVDTFGYDLAGRLVAATSGLHGAAADLARQYDAAGRLVQEDQAGQIVQWSYDRRSLPTQVVTPDGVVLTKTWTPDGMLGSVADVTTTHLALTYDALDRPVQKLLGNGTTTQQTWDGLGRMTAVSHTNAPTDLHSLAYTYDPEGNRVAVTDGTFASRDEVAVHDPLDRLVSWQRSGTAETRRWTLDAVGNWLQRLEGGLLQEREHDPTHALVLLRDVQAGVAPKQPGAPGPFPAGPGGLVPGSPPADGLQPSLADETVLTYDALGRLIHDERLAYEYGLDGRLARVRRADSGQLLSEYAWDPLGRRVLRHDVLAGQQTRFVYDDQRVLQEQDGGGAVLATNVHGSGIDEVAARITPAGTFVYHLDPLGCTLALSDDAGQVVERYGYTPYGRCVTYDPSWSTPLVASRVGNPFVFVGRRLDPESGLLHMRARGYSPELGRFLTRDPLGLSEGPNAYAYAADNPLLNVDPLGTSCHPTHDFKRWWRNGLGVRKAHFQVFASGDSDDCCTWDQHPKLTSWGVRKAAFPFHFNTWKVTEEKYTKKNCRCPDDEMECFTVEAEYVLVGGIPTPWGTVGVEAGAGTEGVYICADGSKGKTGTPG